MNILFLTTHLNAGGITSYLLTLSKGLIRNGHTVHIISAGGNQETSFQKIGIQCLTLNIRTKSELSPKIYFNLSRLKKYISENRIDVIHAQTRVTQVMGRLLQKMTGVAYVSTCHGFFRPRILRKMFGAWGDRVIAISPQVKDHLIKDFSVEENRVCLVDSGLDIDQFVPADDAQKHEVRKKFGYDREILIGIIARFSDVKGQDLLVQAMPDVAKAFPNARLLLIGSGREEALLRQWVQKLSLENHVHFHPVVAQTAEMLSMLDIVVAPSRNEGLGLSIMEAQAMGLPVIGTRVGGIPSVIKDGETGILIESESVVGAQRAVPLLSEAIVRLCGQPDLRQQLGQNARAAAIKNYSSDRMADKTVECYRSVLK